MERSQSRRVPGTVRMAPDPPARSGRPESGVADRSVRVTRRSLTDRHPNASRPAGPAPGIRATEPDQPRCRTEGVAPRRIEELDSERAAARQPIWHGEDLG